MSLHTAAAFRPDGRVFATVTGPWIRQWDAATGKPAGEPIWGKPAREGILE